METVLRVSNVTKAYHALRAVNGISFEVNAGEIVGLLGPNGAGKTTTISMMLGVLAPSAGRIEVLGKEIPKEKAVMSAINFCAVYAQIPGNQTVWQNLYIFGLLYGVKKVRYRIQQVLKEFALEEFAHTKVGVLSSGEHTRVSLAKAMINQPKLLLLDEPTASLDPSTARLIRAKVKEYARTTKAAVLWTSHNMHEVEAVCDRVLFLSHGNIVLEGNPKTLPRQYSKDNLEELFIAVAREPVSFARAEDDE